jgi:hypothetical protein
MVAYFHLTRFDNEGGDVNGSPILQGATFSIVFHYFADVSEYIPRGQIRTDYGGNNGSLLAQFGFDPLVYALVTKADNTQAMATVIVAKLSASVTTDLPIPILRKTVADKNVISSNTYVYDIELESPSGTVIRLIQGYVEILPEVTL